MSRRTRKIAMIVVPFLVLGAGILVMRLLISHRAAAEVVEPRASTTPVEVLRTRAADHPVVIRSTGSVVAAREVTLMAEVAGRVTWVSPELRPGGRFSKGDVVLRIDDRDYRLAIEQQRAGVEQSSLSLQLERGRARVAEREWDRVGKRLGGAANGQLARRQPQLKSARAALQAARSRLEAAQIQLSRTRIRAPFNALVQARSVDVGQVVRPGQTLVSLVGTDIFWVKATVPIADLAEIAVPGGKAIISKDYGRGKLKRPGRVVQVLGDVEPTGLLARVLVQVDRPLGGDGLPLLLGSFVDVAVEGRVERGVHALPRLALRADDAVWVVDKNDTLAIRPVTVVRRMEHTVLVRSDALADGARVVTSRLPSPVAGMPLAPRPSEPSVTSAMRCDIRELSQSC